MNNITLVVMLIFLTLSQVVFAQDQPPPGLPGAAQMTGTPTNPAAPPPVQQAPAQAPVPSAPVAQNPASEPPAPSNPPASVFPGVGNFAPSPAGSAPPSLPPGVSGPSASIPPPPSASDAAQYQKWLSNNGQQLPSQPPPLQPVAEQPPGATPLAVNSAPKQGQLPKSKSLSRVILKKIHEGPNVISPPLTYEQSQEIMLRSAPAPVTPPSDESNEAFNNMMQQNVPLTPQQVVRLRQIIDNSQRAAAIPATVPPKPVSSTIMVNLAPGATPPAIRLAQGYVSSLVFVDSTGAPWPIAAYDIGDPKTMTIQWDPKSNIMLMQAVTPYSQGNLVIRLVGLPTPVTFELVSGQRVVDYRTDIHVPGIGPNAKEIPIGLGLPNSANQLLLGVLDGIAPPGSKQLSVPGSDCKAWLLGDKMYLRTRFNVLSPGWVGKMSSPDGMYAYEIPRTSSVLISQYGNPIELKIEGF